MYQGVSESKIRSLTPFFRPPETCYVHFKDRSWTKWFLWLKLGNGEQCGSLNDWDEKQGFFVSILHLDGVAPLIADPSGCNSTHRQIYPSINLWKMRQDCCHLWNSSLKASLKSSLLLISSIRYPDMWGVQNTLNLSINFENGAPRL